MKAFSRTTRMGSPKIKEKKWNSLENEKWILFYPEKKTYR